MSIRSKLILTFIGLGLAVALALGLSIFFSELVDQGELLLQRNESAQVGLLQMRARRGVEAAYQYVLTGDLKRKEDFFLEMTRFDQSFDNALSAERARPDYDPMEAPTQNRTHREKHRLFEQAQALFKDFESPFALGAVRRNVFGEQAQALHAALDEWMQLERIEEERVRLGLVKAQYDAALRFGLIGAATLILCWGGGVFLSRRIAAPVTALAERARGIAQGDFGARFEWNSRDEIGRLADAFETMRVKLKTAIDDLVKQNKAREESESRYRLLVEQAPAVVYMHDHAKNHPWRYVSPQIEAVVGLPRTSWIIDPWQWQKRIHPEDREQVLDAKARSIDEAQVFRAEYRMRTQLGALVWIRDEARLVRGDDGQPLFWQGLLLDVTKAKADEAYVLETRAMFQTILDVLPAVVFAKDVSSLRYTFWNQAAEDLLGIPVRDVLGKSDAELFPENQAALFQEHDRQAIESGALTLIPEQTIDSPSGPRTLYTRKIVAPDAKGKPLFLLGVGLDVTEQKQSQARLINLNRLYSTLSKAGQAAWSTRDPDLFKERITASAVEEGGFALVWMGVVDPDTLLVKPAASAGAVDYLNFVRISMEDIPEGRGPVGTALREKRSIIVNDVAQSPMMAPWKDYALANGLYSVAAVPFSTRAGQKGALAFYHRETDFFSDEEIALLNSLAEITAFGLDAFNEELQRREAQERLFALNRELENRVAARTEELGLANTVLAKEIDVRQAAEVEARQAARMLSGLFNAVAESAYLLDRDGRVLACNQTAAKRLKRPLDALLGANYFEALPEDAAKERKSWFDDVFAQGEGVRFEDERSGNHFSHSLYPVRDESGQVKQAALLSQDVTEQKRMQLELIHRSEELARSNAELEHFAYVASHDLQEPLRKISSFTQLLAKKYSPLFDETAVRWMGFITDGAERMHLLINDLLDYSRVGSRGKPFEHVDVRALVAQVLSTLSGTIQESGARVVMGDLPPVVADPNQLSRVFQNLIANAVKFRGVQTPEVAIGARTEPGAIVYWVKDNGIGIDPKFHDRVFLMFQRLHTREEYPGTGIGLAICKKIIERHGGAMWIESSAGNGAAFLFRLPERDPLEAISPEIRHEDRP